MSNPVSFVNLYVSKIQTFVQTMEDLRSMNDMVDQDSTLFTRYFADPNARKDIVEADATAAHGSIVQILFTYDSGTPTQKSALFKMLP